MSTDALKRLQSGIDRDERIARAATKLPQPITKYPEKRPPWEPERWEIDRFGDLVSVNGDRNPVHDDGGVRDADTAAHIANWDPARALGLVEAIRMVVEVLKAGGCSWCDDDARKDFEPVLRALAGICTEDPETGEPT